MADIESICARLCLLTQAAWREDLPAPLMRSSVQRMIRLGALRGLTLRDVDGIKEEYYLRAQTLLSRSAQIYEAVKRREAEGYSVLLPEDDAWPVNLCALGVHMPLFLFVRGNILLFSRRSVAVAGSREIEEETVKLARSVGTSIAQEGYSLVCGGAWGVDTAAQSACLASGGGLILVPAYPCHELLRQQYLREALDQGKLLIACDSWPQERFSPRKALTRNHTIYALGDAAVAVASRNGRGGTWNGATDCLRGGYTPLFVPDMPGLDFEGNRELLKQGAIQFDPGRCLGEQLFAQGG